MLATSTATSALGRGSTLVIGGLTAPSLSQSVMGQLLGGEFGNSQRTSVNWPAEAWPFTGVGDRQLGASVDAGVASLEKQIDVAVGGLSRDADGRHLDGEKVTVVGLSAGALVVNELLRRLAEGGDVPAPDQIEFVVVGDSTRQAVDGTRYNPVLDYTYRPRPSTGYDVLEVTGEYDGFADFPDRWWNLLAVANAVAGTVFVHIPVMFTDLTELSETDLVEEVNDDGGTTTRYLVPAERLPLVRALPFLRPWEPQLRDWVDAGYRRNDPDPEPDSSPARPMAVRTTEGAAAPLVPDVAESGSLSTDDGGPAAEGRSGASDSDDSAPARESVGRSHTVDTGEAAETDVLEARSRGTAGGDDGDRDTVQVSAAEDASESKDADPTETGPAESETAESSADSK